jgi:hypothetical protein
MKKALIIAALLMAATPALAGFSLKNLDIFGWNDKQKKNWGHKTEQVNPGTPGEPTPVPEPGTLLLLGSGLVGVLAVSGRFKRSREE